MKLKNSQITSLAAICFFAISSCTRTRGSREQYVHFGTIVNEHGAQLKSAFAGLRREPRLLLLATYEPKRRQRTTQGCPQGNNSASSWFLGLPVVHAQSCTADDCAGHYYTQYWQGCGEACGGGGYNSPYSDSTVATYYRGYQYTGSVTCDPCSQCDRQLCPNIC